MFKKVYCVRECDETDELMYYLVSYFQHKEEPRLIYNCQEMQIDQSIAESLGFEVQSGGNMELIKERDVTEAENVIVENCRARV